MVNTLNNVLEIMVPILLIYSVVIGALMIIRKCGFQEAREIFANFINTKNRTNQVYELKDDQNYIREVNTICKEVLGEKRYEDLCTLTKFTRTIDFDESTGYPSVYITVNPNDENERIRIQNILVQTTASYITNYGYTNLEVTSEWGENRMIKLPMLIIGYSRNPNEADAIKRRKLKNAEKIISSVNTEILDEELL